MPHDDAPRPDRRRRRARSRARVTLATVLLALAVVALAPAGANGADRYRRAFNWSGYRWMVRSTTDRADPGNNRWGDSRANVRVRPDRKLVLDIARDRSTEIVGPATGYGTYRWTVARDLNPAGTTSVAAFFVLGTRGEVDLEFSRWGFPDLAAPGTWVLWRRSTRLGFASFPVTPAPPYALQIDSMVGATRFTVHDGTGAALLDTTVASPALGRHVAPHISYWRYRGRGTVASAGAAPPRRPVVVSSFRYTASNP
jgi:hypothetical protein